MSEEAPAEEAEEPAESFDRAAWGRILWGIGLVVVCLVVYYLSQPNRGNPYLHFVLQAQAWLDGKTAIPLPQYQDVMPILDADGAPTGDGIIPFPPFPAWVLLPFVSIWNLATNEQLLAVVFSAIDVGIAYWMLGYLPVRQAVRVLTSLFLGLGTVLWYTAAIGSTWFWAHVVAVGCLLLSVGLALRADRDAAQPVPARDFIGRVRRSSWPGGWKSAVLLVALGAAGETLFLGAGANTPAAALTAVGVLFSVVAVTIAVVVAGRPGVVAPFAIAVAVVGGIPLVVIGGAGEKLVIAVVDLILILVVFVLWWFSRRKGGRVDRGLSSLSAALSSPEALQVAAGILFGLAVTARLTILFGFPFLMLVGGGGSRLRRTMLAGAGAAVPLVTLLVVTYATSGHLFNPAYDYLYHYEVSTGAFNYNADWSITDIRYIPQNLAIMLFSVPRIMPDFYSIYPNGSAGTALCVAGTARGLFDQGCPLAMPDAIGTSIILTSPAYLLAPLAWRPIRHLQIDRVTAGASIAVVDIAIVNLMHFSQGWVQFGYRFSNDFVPFALILVALGASRLGRLWPLVLLVGMSIVVNLWGTIWGVMLGW
jgi:uncharacterized membrane protein